MQIWKVPFHKGKYFLTHHMHRKALNYFTEALELCPLTEQKYHSKLLFYMGICLKKLGFDNSALKSWILALKFEKIGYSYKMVRRFSNQYGMVKQPSVPLDDWQAFYSIQLSKYLRNKPSKKPGTNAEIDMVRDLIRDTWKELNNSEDFRKTLAKTQSAEKKIALFRRITIVFPVNMAGMAQPNSLWDIDKGMPIPYNFRLKTLQGSEMRCFCGSCLPYQLCCGRITSEEELINGCF